MIIKDMFLKDIDRDIRGVIKVAQTSEGDIYQELDEYVVTKELKKHFSKFYEKYINSVGTPTDKMGVWVSGFFGSGKSHFIKILSYLLANQPVLGENPFDFFESKINNPMVFAMMEKAASVETDTILFNIDSKSSTSYTSKDAILRVFKKVFDEHRGYYGDNPGISKMEKFLDDNGNYEAFKEKYEELAQEPWVGNQNNFYFRWEELVQSLVQTAGMTEENARNWFRNIDNTDDLTIESFAEEVNEFVENKSRDFHLVFLVDEIGQYIGDNRNLMLNLQTVVENLGAKSQGKVWVIVTSQESIDSIVKVKGDDFSRIQGRFDTRLSLSSTSADEVIKKRILEKKPQVIDSLKASYPMYGSILNNLISFRGATGDLRSYSDAGEFSIDYPFIPYQFKLLQNIFEQVRKHGSSGKHLSEGERSMLSAFQEAAQQFRKEEEGVLVPIYAFYNTISEFLNPSVTRVINGTAENPNLREDSFNGELLKVLFMIKYIENIPGNIDNLATLMVTNVNEDKTVLKDKIKEALNKLRQERLIQKNGENYQFLTDEEQDINREIQQIEIEEMKVIREMSEYIFADIYSNKKYKYSNEYDFAFNKQLDSVNYGTQTASINLKLITAQSFDYELPEQDFMMRTMDSPDLLVKLGGDGSYVEELNEVLKIELYRNRTNLSQLSETKQNILNSKQAEIRERRNRAKNFIQEALKEATFYVNGKSINVTGSTAKEKINNGLSYLVENTYSKIAHINEHIQSSRELQEKINSQETSFTFEGNESLVPNSTAKNEILSYIEIQEQMNKQVTTKLIYDRFNDVPFGWKELDIAGILVDLLKEEKIRVRYNSVYLNTVDSQKELLKVFTNSTESAKGIVNKREKVDVSLIRKVKGISRDLFDKTSFPDDEDSLLHVIKELVNLQVEEIQSYKENYRLTKYPGKSLLDKGLEYFNQLNDQLDSASYFNKLVELEDDLLDWKDDYSVLEGFFKSNQRQLFDNGLVVLKKYESNKDYLNTKEIQDIIEQLKEILNNPIPYKQIKNIPGLITEFYEKFNQTLEEMKNDTQISLESDLVDLRDYSNQEGISSNTKDKIDRKWEQLISQLQETTDIYRIDSLSNISKRDKEDYYSVIYQEIKKYEQENEDDLDEDDDVVTPPRVVERVKISEVVPIYMLSNETQVDKYINRLSRNLKDLIKENKTIEIID